MVDNTFGGLFPGNFRNKISLQFVMRFEYSMFSVYVAFFVPQTNYRQNMKRYKNSKLN